MRGKTLRAAPVCAVVFACGCFLGGGGRPPADRPASPPTEAYWNSVAAVLTERTTGQDMPAMVNLVRAQTDRLRELPAEGVDADLVTAVTAVVKAEEEVLRRAEMVDNDPTRLRTSRELAQAFKDANAAAAEAKRRLKALQPTLSTRYGGGFAPIAN